MKKYLFMLLLLSACHKQIEVLKVSKAQIIVGWHDTDPANLGRIGSIRFGQDSVRIRWINDSMIKLYPSDSLNYFK